MKYIYNLVITVLLSLSACSCSNEMPECPEPEAVPAQTDGGYLFAFMTNANYGKLFYAISRDAFSWETLNNGQIIDPEYIGHPDIVQGHDGAFYMMAVTGQNNEIVLWRSEDLVAWDKTPLDPNITNASNADGYYTGFYVGAPKLFYDKDTQQYIMTWHACLVPQWDDWDSMATLYVLTKDFKTFTHPERLFHFSGADATIATIDTIIRKVNGKYYAIFKDERYPEDAPETGKCIRISVSDNINGPYTEAGKPICTWREAPIFVELPGNSGYAIFAENCYNAPWSYNMYVSKTMDTDRLWDLRMYEGPCVADGTSRPGARHGCIVRINENVYQAISNAYSTKK